MTERINQQQSRVLESIVLEKKEKVAFKSWMQPIRNAYPFGQLTFDEKYLLLTESDYEMIAELLKDLLGYAINSNRPLTVTNRLEAASLTNNEKAGGAKAGNDWLLVSTLSGVLRLDEGDYSLPSGCLLVMDREKLTGHCHAIILIVENKAVLPHLSSSIFSGMADYDPLIIYRGDPYFSVAAANDFVIDQQEQCQIHTFFDSDPKGLSMALATPAVSGVWLIDLNNVAELQSVNQETIFQQQSSVDNALAKKCEVCGSELVNYYRLMNQHRIAIMQEHILARNLDIVLFSRKADSQSE